LLRLGIGRLRLRTGLRVERSCAQQQGRSADEPQGLNSFFHEILRKIFATQFLVVFRMGAIGSPKAVAIAPARALLLPRLDLFYLRTLTVLRTFCLYVATESSSLSLPGTLYHVDRFILCASCPLE
jgi:hypothetical protein